MSCLSLPPSPSAQSKAGRRQPANESRDIEGLAVRERASNTRDLFGPKNAGQRRRREKSGLGGSLRICEGAAEWLSCSVQPIDCAQFSCASPVNIA